MEEEQIRQSLTSQNLHSSQRRQIINSNLIKHVVIVIWRKIKLNKRNREWWGGGSQEGQLQVHLRWLIGHSDYFTPGPWPEGSKGASPRGNLEQRVENIRGWRNRECHRLEAGLLSLFGNKLKFHLMCSTVNINKHNTIWFIDSKAKNCIKADNKAKIEVKYLSA